MNSNFVFWLYLINSVILINHEIDSAYWQEWKLIKPEDKGGINAFLILHIPMLFLILLGLVLVYTNSFAGLVISMIVSFGGIFAFVFHFYHLRKGRPEFNTPLSKTLIISSFIVSLFQIVFTLHQFIT